MRRFTILLCLVASLAYGQQQVGEDRSVEQPCEGRTIERSTMLGIGSTEILDTYLSQEKYRGTEVRFVSHTIAKRQQSRWSRLILHQGFIAWAKTRSGNGGEMEGIYNFQYGYLYNWHLCQQRLHIAVGAAADATLGVLYNTHGGNNPAQAKLQFAITPTASADYSFTIGSMPLKASYEVGIPLMGFMFSPNYGQSYYEIFNRGNYDHNVIFTHPVNAPSLRQMLAIDATFGRTTLRIGYLGDIRQSKVNNIKAHTYTHAFVLGFTRKFSVQNL